MMNRRPAFILPILLLFTLCSIAYGEELPPENLDKLLASALAQNPEIRAAEARSSMYASKVRQESSLPDPMLMLGIQNGLVKDPLNFKAESMTSKVIGVSQELPFWGKRGLRAEMAGKEAESYRWGAEARRRDLVRMVKESYFRLYMVDRELAIVERNLQLMDTFIELAETRYGVGQGIQQDVFKAQVEKAKMLEMRISLEQQRREGEVELNALLARSPSTQVGPIPEFELQPVAMTAKELQRLAEENRPEFKALEAQKEKGSAAQRLARREQYPDFTVSLEYMQREAAMEQPGDDMYSLGVTFNLPLQRGRRNAMVAEASAETSMAEAELAMERNNVQRDIARLLAELQRRSKLVELYQDGILPQASASLESATISYQVNKVDFMTLLDSGVTLFNYERELYNSKADYQMKRAQLEALVGTAL